MPRAPARRARRERKESLNKNNNKIRERAVYSIPSVYLSSSDFNTGDRKEFDESDLEINRNFSLKIPVLYLKIYKRLDDFRKKMVREILREAFKKALEGVANVRLDERVVNVVMPVQVNMNIAKTEVSGDEVLLKRLRNLERKLREYKQLVTEYEEEISRLRKEVSDLRKAKEELESRLRTALPETVKRQVISDVKSVLYRLARQGLITRETLDIILKEIENLYQIINGRGGRCG